MLHCHGSEYDDLLTLFHFSSSDTFFLQYVKIMNLNFKLVWNGCVNKLFFH